MNDRAFDVWTRQATAKELPVNTAHVHRLTYLLTSASSRRAALGLGVGGVLAALRLADTDAKRKRKKTCKPKCGPCRRCKKGKCRKKPNGTACGNGQFCSGGTCGAPADPPADPPANPPTCGTGGPCRVFVTSTFHAGDFGGLSAADAICQQRAQAANLPGTYLAWLSDATQSPATRFPTQSTGPYRLVDGTTIATNWVDLTDVFNPLAAPINLTETGEAVEPPFGAWTHTIGNGTAGAVNEFRGHCQNWSTTERGEFGSIGLAGETGGDWTAVGASDCRALLHFYCFQQN